MFKKLCLLAVSVTMSVSMQAKTIDVPLNCEGLIVTVTGDFVLPGEKVSNRKARFESLRKSLVISAPLLGYTGSYKSYDKKTHTVILSDNYGNTSAFVMRGDKGYYVRIGSKGRNIHCNEMQIQK